MKIRIVSTVPIKSRWLDEVKTFLPEATFDLTYTKKLPTVTYRFDQQSMYGDFASVRAIIGQTDADARVYIMSQDQLRGLGITNHIALYDNTDRDGVLDTYIGLDTRTVDQRAIDNGFTSNFAWEICHELAHGREQNLGKEYMATNGDRTHAMEAQSKLKELWGVETITTLAYTVLGLLRQLLALTKPTMKHPVPLPYRNQITQQYGVANPIYRLTGHHIGADHSCPIGTPLSAPADGRVIVSSVSPQRGNYIQFQHGGYVLEMRHLSRLVPLGVYKQGETLAWSGNSGDLTSGPHVCVVVFIGKDNLPIISKTNWSTLTVDCNKLYS